MQIGNEVSAAAGAGGLGGAKRIYINVVFYSETTKSTRNQKQRSHRSPNRDDCTGVYHRCLCDANTHIHTHAPTN